ncbi:MAG: hypothetical protein EA397_03340 [Deltaproteobacteria bacterium]|nr:MAG: hypothetical protein EA397_03340 [Deltaproteobacteria bacterium]
MERLVAVLGFGLVASGALALGIWWVQSQRRLHRRGDPKALRRRREALRRSFGWLLVALLVALTLAILFSALG